jgi:Ca2+-binding RTX toxin-like protein
MAFNIMTFGVLGVDADALTAGNQQLNGDVGTNELTAANLINSNGIPFQQLLLFVGAANNGDLNINDGETAFNLSDMGAGGAVVSLGATNNNDPVSIRANGLTNANTVGNLTANVYYDNTRGFGLANVRDKTAASSWLNSGDSLTFSTMAINGVNQFIASVSFVVNVNGGGSEHVIIDFDGNVVRQDGTNTTVDGIDLGLIANGTTVSLNFAAHTIAIGATTRAMTDAELSLFQQAGLNQVTIGSLNTSTQGFAIKNLSILATDTPVSGVVVQAPATGGETHGTPNDDILIGSAAADVLNAGAGNDVVYAGDGNDIINAGDGNDRVDGGDGNDIVQTQTGAGSDIIDGGSGLDQAIVTTTGAGDTYVIAPYTLGGVIYAGIDAQSTAGIDVSTTNVEEIVLHAGASADTILIQGDLSTAGVAQSTVIVYGGAGDDVIDASGLVGSPPVEAELYGEGGNDTITGGGNNDIIDGGAGVDQLRGNDGDDILIAGGNTNVAEAGEIYDGGNGVDTLRIGVGAVLPNGFHQVGFFNATQVLSIERLEFGDTAPGDNQVVFTTAQMGGGIANNATIVGSSNGDTLVFLALGAGAYNLAGTSYTFENWTTNGGEYSRNDHIVLLGAIAGAAYTFVGSDRGDVLQGNTASDNLQGGLGDDVLIGLAGADSYNGGAGNDDILIGSNIPGYTENYSLETFDGGADTDILYVRGQYVDLTNSNIVLSNFEGIGVAGVLTYTAGPPVVQGPPLLGGNVVIDRDILLQLPTALLVSGSGSTLTSTGAYLTQEDILTVIVEPGDAIDMSTWTFKLWDEAEDYIDVIGSTANDTIIGSSMADSLAGMAGDDVINGGDGDDGIAGGDDNDNLDGGAGNDLLQGGFGTDTLYGGVGDDILAGFDGTDTLYGGDGNDFLLGAQGAILQSSFAEFIYGGAGNDFMRGGTGNDVLDGGDGFDRLSYFGVGGLTGLGVTVDLNQQNGMAQNTSGGGWDTLISIEDVSGSELNDTILGSGTDESLHGGGGDDIIHAGDGNDVLLGDGLAVLGNDLLDGGNGVDTIDYNFRDLRTEGVNVNLSTGVGGTISGGEIDTLISIENVIGTAFSDSIVGSNTANVLNGGGGSDTLEGGAGDDTFAFSVGEANGDIIVDFAGNGASVGDSIEFHGYGTAAEGATFVQIDATHWQINSADGLIHDVITLANGATVDASDYIFGP